MERILEILLVGIVGVSLATHWDPRSLVLAAGLIFIVRPAATLLLLTNSPTTRLQRMLLLFRRDPRCRLFCPDRLLHCAGHLLEPCEYNGRL